MDEDIKGMMKLMVLLILMITVISVSISMIQTLLIPSPSSVVFERDERGNITAIHYIPVRR